MIYSTFCCLCWICALFCFGYIYLSNIYHMRFFIFGSFQNIIHIGMLYYLYSQGSLGCLRVHHMQVLLAYVVDTTILKCLERVAPSSLQNQGSWKRSFKEPVLELGGRCCKVELDREPHFLLSSEYVGRKTFLKTCLLGTSSKWWAHRMLLETGRPLFGCS